jgi:hypothetical protein
MAQSERLERLAEAYRAHGFQANPAAAEPALDWDEVRRLHRQGHTIGAHSETHAMLTAVPRADAEREIAGSIARVGEELGAPCASFAFPNGNHSDELARFALGCGVRTVMTADPTWLGEGEEFWRLPRVQIHATQSPPWHQLKVFVAAFGCLLGSADDTGRGYVRRRRRRGSQAAAPRASATGHPAPSLEPRPTRDRSAMEPSGVPPSECSTP